MVAGQISITYTLAYALIDSGASHSFVSSMFVKKLDIEPFLLGEACIVSLLLGETLTSQFSVKELFEYKGTPQGSKWPVVSAKKVSRMLLKGCVGYLASIVDTTKKVVTELTDVRVVCKFSDVFPKELLGYT